MPALLFETDANPAPERIEAGHFTAHNGKPLRYALLKASSHPSRGTVVLLQGRNEFIEKYYETIDELAMRGFAVATFDWRGQGGSHRLLRDPLRGYVRRFEDYGDDLDRFLTEIVLPDCPPPVYMLAHSSGALVALASLNRLASRITRMVLCAPFLGLSGLPFNDDTARRITSSMRLLGLGRLYASGGRNLAARPFAGNSLTSDPARYMRNMEMVRKYSALALGGPTVRWIWGALHTARRVSRPDFLENPVIPILIVAAGADRVVSTTLTERFASRTRNVSLVTIDGARHEILQEADFYREQFWAAFDAFIPGSADTTASKATEPELSGA